MKSDVEELVFNSVISILFCYSFCFFSCIFCFKFVYHALRAFVGFSTGTMDWLYMSVLLFNKG